MPFTIQWILYDEYIQWTLVNGLSSTLSSAQSWTAQTVSRVCCNICALVADLPTKEDTQQFVLSKSTSRSTNSSTSGLTNRLNCISCWRAHRYPAIGLYFKLHNRALCATCAQVALRTHEQASMCGHCLRRPSRTLAAKTSKRCYSLTLYVRWLTSDFTLAMLATQSGLNRDSIATKLYSVCVIRWSFDSLAGKWHLSEQFDSKLQVAWIC